MTIILNDTPTQVEDGLTVGALVAMQMQGGAGCAVAVNDKVIRRADWDAKVLQPGDKILIIKAAYGG